ncbi:MAG TPA: STAS domain-containing protein [Terriglobales bacterium]|nr:STAS domain-containing protein [Terriglobales bacterium]
MLDIQTRTVSPDVVILEISGRITLGRECKQIEWSTESLVRENRKKVVFDLSGVTHIDSTGIGIIVMSASQLKQAGGALRVCAQGRVEEILKLTNVDKVVSLHPTIAAASAGF